MNKKYSQCDKVLDIYPEWKLCGRVINQDQQRCAEHPVKILWPTED